MYIYIPIYTLLNGYSSEQAAIMLSCIGGLSFFSRGELTALRLVLIMCSSDEELGLCASARSLQIVGLSFKWFYNMGQLFPGLP